MALANTSPLALGIGHSNSLSVLQGWTYWTRCLSFYCFLSESAPGSSIRPRSVGTGEVFATHPQQDLKSSMGQTWNSGALTISLHRDVWLGGPSSFITLCLFPPPIIVNLNSYRQLTFFKERALQAFLTSPGKKALRHPLFSI